jgi:thiol-disulfide isomerase/thioredoxin
VIALLAALACALAGGALWCRRNGRMRSVGGRAASTGRTPETSQASARAEATQAAVRTDAETPAAGGQPLTSEATPGQRLTSELLGQPLGERATFVQFSSSFCAPCRATRRILADVAGMTEGVAHIEIDAESRLDLVRSLNVLRTPTVLVTDAEGRIVKRASGQPRKPDVIAALGEAAGASFPTYLVGKEDSDSSRSPA